MLCSTALFFNKPTTRSLPVPDSGSSTSAALPPPVCSVFTGAVQLVFFFWAKPALRSALRTTVRQLPRTAPI